MIDSIDTSDLVRLAQNGDDIAKEKLISFNAPLIKSIVKRYLNKGIEYDDLYQLGAMGFVKAINNFKAEFNVKFTTYAVPMIAGEIKRFLRDDGSIKVSRSIKHTWIRIKNYINEYQQKYGKTPTIETISNELVISKNDLILAMEASNSPLSLNDQSSEDDLTLMDKISDNFSVDKFFDKLTMRDMIEKLTAREKQIIIMRYYLDKTQSEIAKELGVSQVQVSRIENKVLKELKEEIDL